MKDGVREKMPIYDDDDEHPLPLDSLRSPATTHAHANFQFCRSTTPSAGPEQPAAAAHGNVLTRLCFALRRVDPHTRTRFFSECRHCNRILPSAASVLFARIAVGTK